MLTSTTPEAYVNVIKNKEDFINKDEKLEDLNTSLIGGIIVEN